MRGLYVVISALVAAGCISVPEFHGTTDAGNDADADGSNMSCAQAIGVAGLLVYLPFDSISSDSVEDASPNNHDGIVLGGATLGAGRHGMGVVLDGFGKAIDLGSPAALNNLDTVTACAWVNLSMFNQSAPGATIADKTTDGFVGGWSSYLDHDNATVGGHVAYLAREGAWAYSAAEVRLSTWTHTCTVWSNSAVSVYVDGQFDGIQRMGTVHPLPAHDDSNNHLVLGRQTNSNQYYLLGTLDDFVLYNRALSATEIAAIHACSP